MLRLFDYTITLGERLGVFMANTVTESAVTQSMIQTTCDWTRSMNEKQWTLKLTLQFATLPTSLEIIMLNLRIQNCIENGHIREYYKIIQRYVGTRSFLIPAATFSQEMILDKSLNSWSRIMSI